jgi:hypothetical protein
MKKIQKLTEKDLTNIIKRVIKEDQNFSEYLKYVNVVGRSIAKEISGDDSAMYVDLVPKIENWFMNNVSKISNMGYAATEHISQQSK